METVKASFDWKINNFTKIYKNIDYIQLSKTFCNPDFPLVEWQLFLEMVKNGTYVTVWLRQIGPNSKNELTSTKYKIWSEHEDFKIVISKSSYKFEHQDKLGLAEVPTEALRVNGHLLLKCEVVVERYSLLENLQNNYKKMLDSGSFADFKFKVGTEEMVAHRCVLSQNSDVFKTMFDQSGMTEA